MKKPNPMIAKMEAQIRAKLYNEIMAQCRAEIEVEMDIKYKILFDQKMDMAMQLVVDAAFLSANDVFKMGPGRCEAFGDGIQRYLNEIGHMMWRDQKDDPEYIYTREKVDQRLKQICWDKFVPWEVRYGQAGG